MSSDRPSYTDLLNEVGALTERVRDLEAENQVLTRELDDMRIGWNACTRAAETIGTVT
jgi:hypothetical protein